MFPLVSNAVTFAVLIEIALHSLVNESIALNNAYLMDNRALLPNLN